MARYTYNAGLVTQTIDTLYAACDTLDSTNVDMKKGIDMIYNARGAENINIDFSPITGYQSSVIEYIETMATEIQKKAQEIEEYQDAPWYKKLFATIGMGALKLVEGLASFVEQIGDGLVSIVGFIGGIFSSDFKDCIGEFVKKDWVGDTTAKWYEEGWLQSVNKYSIMSHESTAANILKGVGVAAGYVILSVATAGAGTAVSLGVSAVAAGVGGIGSGTQSGLQAGKTFNQAFGQGVKQGVVAAGTTLIVGGLANKLGSLAKGSKVLAGADDVVNATDDVINATDDVLNATDDVLNAADDVINASDDVLKTTTSFADEIATNLDDGTKIVGKAIAENGDELVVVQNAAGQTGAFVKSGGKIGQLMTDNIDEIAANITKNGGVYDDIGGLLTNVDDVANAGSTALTVVDDLANAGSNSLMVIDDAVNIVDDAVNIVDDVANVADDVANAAKPTLGQKLTGLVDKGVKWASNTKVGGAIGNAAAAIGPTGVNAIAAGAGSVTGGMATAPVTDMAIHEMNAAIENPGIGQQLYTESQSALEQNIPSSATEQQAQQNLQDRQDQGYTPGSSSPEVTQAPTNVTQAPTATATSPSAPRPTATSPSGTRPSVTAPEITMPEYTTQPPQQTTAPTPTPNATTPRPEEQVISTISPINPTTGPTGPTGPGNPGISNLTDPSTITTGTKDIVSSEVLDTFGNVSGSLSDISGSKTNIPTSSSPILSSDGGSSNSKLVPLGAGLGAASLAGIGAKAYLDKREKSEEDEEDELETEEWASQDDMEIDYGLETDSEEADYLSPTDELAFTE